MPVCVVCKTTLPPDFLIITEDGLAKKCLFCTRQNDTIEYFSEKEGKQLKVTKSETSKEYVGFLREMAEIASIKDILDVIKEKKDKDVIST